MIRRLGFVTIPRADCHNWQRHLEVRTVDSGSGMNRRDVLCSTLALLAPPALAQRAPITAFTDYERDSGGHIGVYAKNLKTGALLSWRAHERFLMCSSFKAFLAARGLGRVDGGGPLMEERGAHGPGR